MRRKATMHMDPMPYEGSRTTALSQLRRPMHVIPWGAIASVAAPAVGALMSGDGPGDPSWQNQTSTGFLGNLPPELEGLDIQQLLQQGAISQEMFDELMNSPDALSYQNLSQSALGGGVLGGMDLNALPGQIGQAVNEGYDQSFQTAEAGLQRQMDFLGGQAQRQADGAISGITGGMDALGLRGSTAQGNQIANALGGINANYQNTVGQLGQGFGQFQSQQALGRAQGLQSGYALQGQLAGQMGGLMLADKGQQMTARGMMDSNRNTLMSDPAFQNLQRRRESTGGQQTITDTKYA